MSVVDGIIGKKIGRLTVVGVKPRSAHLGGPIAVCDCECGVKGHEANIYNVASGRSRSCGCKAVGLVIHGKTGFPVHKLWLGMRKRCENKKDKDFLLYGARGIKVSDRWHDFANFYEDMGDRPEGTSLDRIDNNGDYSKENCRWATPTQQARNTRHNKVVSFRGEKKTVAEWSEHLGIPYMTLYSRITRGWPLVKAFCNT